MGDEIKLATLEVVTGSTEHLKIGPFTIRVWAGSECRCQIQLIAHPMQKKSEIDDLKVF